MFHDPKVARAPVSARARWSVVSRLVVAGVVAVGAAVAVLPASATPVRDRDSGAALTVVRRLVEVDATLRTVAVQLPAAESRVALSTIAVAAARADEVRVRASGPPAPVTSSGGASNSVATAILAELAPEGATAARVRAEQTLATAIAQRDALRTSSTDASAERLALLAALDHGGDRRTFWSVQLLDRLTVPVTTDNVRALAAWIEAEFNRADLNNPLATTMAAPGARNVNDHGVKAYPTEAIGLDATVRTLQNGLYPGILSALVAGDSALRVVQAVALSPWGTGVNAVRRLQMDG